MIKRNKYFLVTVVSLLLLSSLAAQSKATIAGVVKDGITGEELIGAAVFIKEINLGAVTELDGSYRITSIPAGDYTVEISYLGYVSINFSVTLTDGQTLTKNASLEYESMMTEEIVVTAQAEGQIASINQQLADPTIKNIISAKKIQEIPNANAAEAIGRIPGVSIVINH